MMRGAVEGNRREFLQLLLPFLFVYIISRRGGKFNRVEQLMLVRSKLKRIFGLFILD